MSDRARLTVREMRLDEVGLRIDYFHDASDEYLRTLGVDRSLLPGREAWLAQYEEDYARPLRQRRSYLLAWELDGDVVGFSSTDRIEFGEQAFMHLHILRDPQRRGGLGAEFVRQSAAVYFEVLELRRLYCEPNAFNVAPNRTLQRAGFTYLFSHEAAPSSINFMQVTTRWVLDRPGLLSG
jgi:RimJ/RimL family protein N-acetyltransferase